MCYYELSDVEHAFVDFVMAATLGDTLATQFVNSMQKEIQPSKN